MYMLNSYPNRKLTVKKIASLMQIYEYRGIYVIFLLEEKTFSVKQPVTNITECGCMKSPVPSASCRSLQQHFADVVKN